MKQMYYRDEYTEKQWHALIDEAAKLGCTVTYGKYGDRAEIDSTDVEDRLLGAVKESDGATRLEWAEHIHGRMQKAADLRKWVVQPARRYHGRGFRSECHSQRAAEYERERLERSTGYAWKIIVTQE